MWRLRIGSHGYLLSTAEQGADVTKKARLELRVPGSRFRLQLGAV